MSGVRSKKTLTLPRGIAAERLVAIGDALASAEPVEQQGCADSLVAHRR